MTNVRDGFFLRQELSEIASYIRGMFDSITKHHWVVFINEPYEIGGWQSNAASDTEIWLKATVGARQYCVYVYVPLRSEVIAAAVEATLSFTWHETAQTAFKEVVVGPCITADMKEDVYSWLLFALATKAKAPQFLSRKLKTHYASNWHIFVAKSCAISAAIKSGHILAFTFQEHCYIAIKT